VCVVVPKIPCPGALLPRWNKQRRSCPFSFHSAYKRLCLSSLVLALVVVVRSTERHHGLEI
jgi:hypothetical protein